MFRADAEVLQLPLFRSPTGDVGRVVAPVWTLAPLFVDAHTPLFNFLLLVYFNLIARLSGLASCGCIKMETLGISIESLPPEILLEIINYVSSFSVKT